MDWIHNENLQELPMPDGAEAPGKRDELGSPFFLFNGVQRGISEGVKDRNVSDLPEVFRASEEPQLVLLTGMLQQKFANGSGLHPDEHRAGTSGDNAAPLGQDASFSGTRPPHQREQARQPIGKLAVVDGPRPHQPASLDPSQRQGMPELRKDIHPGPEVSGPTKDLLKDVPVSAGIEDKAVPAIQGFLIWQQRMRGALSRLPMASGPWIWKPPMTATDQRRQLELFGGNHE
jgi:hypothetical protein